MALPWYLPEEYSSNTIWIVSTVKCKYNHENIASMYVIQEFPVDVFEYIFVKQMCKYHRSCWEDILAISYEIALT